MSRVKAEKRAELEAFWRSHHEEWQKGTLNQREYCELHGLPLKRFGNWRAQFRHEASVAQAKLLYRRGGLSPRTSPRTGRETEPVSPGYIPSVRAVPEARRNFSEADKKRIVAEAMRPGASVSKIARRYGIATALLFRWRKELALPASPPSFLSVTIDDGADLPPLPAGPPPVASPVIIERSPLGIEVELRGGRRVRFDRDMDPETVRSLIALLEGAAP